MVMPVLTPEDEEAQARLSALNDKALHNWRLAQAWKRVALAYKRDALEHIARTQTPTYDFARAERLEARARKREKKYA